MPSPHSILSAAALRLVAVVAVGGAAATAAASGRSSWVAVSFFAPGLVGPNVNAGRAQDGASMVAFYNPAAGMYLRLLWLKRRFGFIAPLGGGAKFLIARRARHGSLIREYNAATGKFTTDERLPISLGDPNPPAFWWFKVGPGGLLWGMGAKGIVAYRWPSAKPVFRYRGPLAVGVPAIFPVKGGAVFVDTSVLANPAASESRRPKMLFLSSRGHAHRLQVPRRFVGTPLFAVANGRALFGMTAFGGYYFRFKLAKNGDAGHFFERRVFGHRNGLQVYAFARAGDGHGALLVGRGGLDDRCQLWIIALRSGAVLDRWKFRLSGSTVVYLHGRFYVFALSGAVLVVNSAGKIVGRCMPPLPFSAVVSGR